mgnify:CR=1 FL=1
MKRLGLIVAASLGLAAGTVIAQIPQLMVPKAYAAPPAAPVKHEYICVDAPSGLSNELNKWGKDGWDLVSVTSKNYASTTTSYVACMKRVVPG